MTKKQFRLAYQARHPERYRLQRKRHESSPSRKLWHKKWAENNKDKVKASQCRFKKRFKKQRLCYRCPEHRPLTNKNLCSICQGKYNEGSRLKREVVKLEVFTAYGGAVCRHCKMQDIRCLTLDHVNNDGASERKRLFGDRSQAGYKMYSYLKKNGFPDRHRYQVLCRNCQEIKKCAATLLPTSPSMARSA